MTRLAIRVGRRPRPVELDDLLRRLADGPVTYEHVGSTLDSEPRPSVRCTTLVVGSGQAEFERAVDGLRRWLPQQALGARVFPASAPIRAGTDLVVALGMGPITVLAPNRIVAVIDEPDRFSFAYGSLPGHPESGEESFSLRLLDDGGGTVRFTVCVDAIGATPIVRLGGPMVEWFQRRAIRRYLDAIADHVSSARLTG